MKLRLALGCLTGSLLVLAAFAHALAGWPPLRSQLTAVGAGRHSGSVAMLS